MRNRRTFGMHQPKKMSQEKKPLEKYLVYPTGSGIRILQQLGVAVLLPRGFLTSNWVSLLWIMRYKGPLVKSELSRSGITDVVTECKRGNRDTPIGYYQGQDAAVGDLEKLNPGFLFLLYPDDHSASYTLAKYRGVRETDIASWLFGRIKASVVGQGHEPRLSSSDFRKALSNPKQKIVILEPITEATFYRGKDYLPR